MAKSAVRFRDSVAQFKRLSADIAARRFAPVYLLMGDASYFIDALCDRLASTILGEAERSFNQIVLYGRDTEPGQVSNFCRQMPRETLPSPQRQQSESTICMISFYIILSVMGSRRKRFKSLQR